MTKNGEHIVANKADIVGLAELKLTKKQMGPWKKNFEAVKKKLLCVSSDFSRKVPQAGVGLVGGQKVRLVEAQIKTSELRKVFEEGRAIKAYAECGWHDNMIFYEVYFENGNTTKTKEQNEAIIEAIRAEMCGEEGVPTAIMGDFNGVPNESKGILDLIENCYVGLTFF